MAQQSWLYVFQGHRLSQQGVGFEVQHTQAQIETGTPICVDIAQLGGTERGPFDRRAGPAVGRDSLVRAKGLVGSGGRSRHPNAPDSWKTRWALLRWRGFQFDDGPGGAI